MMSRVETDHFAWCFTGNHTFSGHKIKAKTEVPMDDILVDIAVNV